MGEFNGIGGYKFNMNIHINALADIKNAKRAKIRDMYDAYKKLIELSNASFLEHMPDVVHLTIHMVCQTEVEFFARKFSLLRELNKSANILWTGADVMCVQETDVFDHTEMRMFGLAKERFQKAVCGVGYDFKPYLNCDIAFFPQGIPDEVWDKGQEVIYRPDENCWDYEQIAYNMMVENKEHDSKYAFQFYPMPIRRKSMNNCTRKEAHLVHYHSSRGPEACIEKMRRQI